MAEVGQQNNRVMHRSRGYNLPKGLFEIPSGLHCRIKGHQAKMKEYKPSNAGEISALQQKKCFWRRRGEPAHTVIHVA